jgi:N-acetylneuraminic acid mutarotase
VNSTLFSVVISILLISSTVNCQDIDWKQKQSLPKEYRNGSAAACKGKVYFMGGYCHSTPERFEKSNYEYDPETDTWTSKADMPTGHSNFALIAIEDKIYAIGGDPFSSQNEVHTPATDSWKTLQPMLTPRQHINGAVVDGKIYIIGGLMDFKNSSAPSDWSYKNISDKNEVYNPSTNTWEERAPMPTRRHGAFITAVNGKIFVIGGMGDENDIWKSLSVVEMYDPETNTWETKKSLPESRDGFGISVINDKIYVIGGFSISGVVNTVRVYDTQLDSWSMSTEFPNLENGSAGCASVGNKIFVIGGCDSKYVANGNTFVGVLTLKK